VSEPFLSEIRILSFNYAPKGWAFCNGSLLPINQNQALFSLLGTTYGGDGRSTFGLPNLQGRIPMHMGNGHTLGEVAGEQSHTLSINELPTHTHQLLASSNPAANFAPASDQVLAKSAFQFFGALTQGAAMVPSSATSVGGSQAHLNMQPYLALNFSIALQGIFPSQT
jgi:microcystin-dependent protein